MGFINNGEHSLSLVSGREIFFKVMIISLTASLKERRKLLWRTAGQTVYYLHISIEEQMRQITFAPKCNKGGICVFKVHLPLSSFLLKCIMTPDSLKWTKLNGILFYFCGKFFCTLSSTLILEIWEPHKEFMQHYDCGKCERCAIHIRKSKL